MSRYIDADALMLCVNCHGTNKYGVLHDVDIRAFIDEQPTIDAVPVVRCGECKHWEVFKSGVNGWCKFHGCGSDSCYYCADGERKEK